MMAPPALTSPLRNQHAQRPASAQMNRSARSVSRLSMSSKADAANGSSRLPEDEDQTAVRVAIRVRPPLSSTDPGYDLVPQRFRRSTCEVTSPSNIVVQSSQGKKVFIFDKVFDESESQQAVWDYISDSIDSFVQGYNVSLLAYGQSGAGKSYTMGTSGPEEQQDPATRGIVSRAAAALFDKLNGPPTSQKSHLRSPKRYSTNALPTLQSMAKPGGEDKTWQLKATYVEIYNEQLRDLLIPEDTPQHERPQVSIREDTKGRILLTGLTQLDINSIEDLLSALEFGSSIRQTDATAINAKSSRSHAVFSLNLIQRRPAPQGTTSRLDKRRSVPIESLATPELITTDSKLHFVDLAGSERLKNTGAQGDRAKEGISINAGLASLGKVISQLSSRHPVAHVSYRDSRLTRLLQDSLGGNAITYMIACINPAEFHLSETLNTVHYASRARDIQSKPTIQQSLNEGDKLALIDRLRAEVAFLREQVTSDRSDKRLTAPLDRSTKTATDLQNQLLEAQENYHALCQRHEKLITELGRSGEGQQAQLTNGTISADAVQRLERSTNFAEAVENVVLEYETTIQRLESSLSNTRTTLSSTESSLLERESKISYLEAVARQHAKKIQKLSDREAQTEQYLHQLEVQLDGATTNEESTSSLIGNLRQELHKAKDDQSSTEEYIIALEGRLAEAEQDHEIMKQELDRLEHVVERQRTLNRLDSSPQQGKLATPSRSAKGSSKAASMAQANGVKVETNGLGRDSAPPSPLGPEHDGYNSKFDRDQPSPVSPLDDDMDSPFVAAKSGSTDSSETDSDDLKEEKQNAQTTFLADKLETLTQELFDLRGEHETVITDHDELRRKYAIALQTLAKLQDSEEKAEYEERQAGQPQRSDSFLGQTLPGASQHNRGASLQSASPAYSSRASSHEEPQSPEQYKTPPASAEGEDSTDEVEDSAAPTEVPTPTHVAAATLPEAEALELSELQSNHDKLLQAHRESLLEVEFLKSELQKSSGRRGSSSPAMKSPLVRRKPSQDIINTMGNVDRANRSFASLRNIALDHFEAKPEARSGFETHLNTIMTELHSKSERSQQLDTELITVRRQLDEKVTIINGLTRERSSLKATPTVDFSAITSMQDQLATSEKQIKDLQETHSKQEQELQAEITALKAQIDQRLSSAESAVNGDTPALSNDELTKMRAEIQQWQTKHDSVTNALKTTESTLLKTIDDLEVSLQAALKNNANAKEEHDRAMTEIGAVLVSQKSEHSVAIEQLQDEIAQYAAASQAQADKLAELEGSQSATGRSLDNPKTSDRNIEEDLAKQRDLTAQLQTQLQRHQESTKDQQNLVQALKDIHTTEMQKILAAEKTARDEVRALQETHEKSLASLKEEHATEIQQLQASEKSAKDVHSTLQRQHSGALQTLQATHAAELQKLQASQQTAREGEQSLQDQHNKALTELQQQVRDHQSNSSKTFMALAALIGMPTNHSNIQENVQILVTAKKDLEEQVKALQANNSQLEGTVKELRSLHDESLKSLEQLKEREAKSSRLVQELEDQISSTFDQSQVHSKRVSQMQTANQLQLQEALHAKWELEKEVEESRKRVSILENQVVDLHRRSGIASAHQSLQYRDSLSPEAAAIALARSASTTSNSVTRRPSPPVDALPSPPPSVPLPPLPRTASMQESLDGRVNSPSPNPGNFSSRPTSPYGSGLNATPDPAFMKEIEDRENRIKTVEKHLFAEKQLTATLEEALVDLETAQNKTRQDADAWRKKATTLEDELIGLRKERSNGRASLQAVEEEREARVRAERARSVLEERMKGLEIERRKMKNKKGALNCF